MTSGSPRLHLFMFGFPLMSWWSPLLVVLPVSDGVFRYEFDVFICSVSSDELAVAFGGCTACLR